jgi:hypothetical protein
MTNSAQDRRGYAHLTHGAVRDRRPGHSSHRTLRGVDRPHHPCTIAWPAPWAGPALQGQRRRTGLPGRGPGAAALPGRRPLAAGRAQQGRDLFARLLSQSAYNRRLRLGGLAAGGRPAVAGLPHRRHRGAAAAVGWHPGGVRPLADHPMRSELDGWAGYGHDTSHHCFYWGSRLLLLVCTPDGTVTGFGLANPKLVGERQAVVGMLQAVPANRPAPGTLLVGDKGRRAGRSR